MARIALDAMGGDFAPRATVAGALLALSELADEHVIELVGRSDVIQAMLDELTRGEFAASAAAARGRIHIVEAPDVVEMSEKPTNALRNKPNSSMLVGLRRHAEGVVQAFVSAGNTGAQMAASTVMLRLAPGLTRPAIGTLFPTAGQPVLVLDVGANVDCSAEELVQFARIGVVYAEDMLGRQSPVVGLLSIGEEAGKGNAAVKEANQLLAAMPGLNFQGNVEGRDLANGASDRGPFDVVVCDGFVGNVVLKFYEAMAPLVISMVGESTGMDRAALDAAFRHLDYSEHGGAPLLGVRGVSIISHGKSSPRAIMNALKVAARAVESRLAEHVTRRLGADTEAVA
ncbi:MAG TPA: phosphate acyltransferase PlsX [Gemmatimonadaceae bacterium]|nr:phosphate acyltransferase PlsX [Gemmatimonadaceae bacterium]